MIFWNLFMERASYMWHGQPCCEYWAFLSFHSSSAGCDRQSITEGRPHTDICWYVPSLEWSEVSIKLQIATHLCVLTWMKHLIVHSRVDAKLNILQTQTRTVTTDKCRYVPSLLLISVNLSYHRSSRVISPQLPRHITSAPGSSSRDNGSWARKCSVLMCRQY